MPVFVVADELLSSEEKGILWRMFSVNVHQALFQELWLAALNILPVITQNQCCVILRNASSLRGRQDGLFEMTILGDIEPTRVLVV